MEIVFEWRYHRPQQHNGHHHAYLVTYHQRIQNLKLLSISQKILA